MDRLAKLLFPDYPKAVRFRKLQAVYFAAFLCVAACVAVGVTIFLMNQLGVK
jgi:hypothetical protein